MCGIWESAILGGDSGDAIAVVSGREARGGGQQGWSADRRCWRGSRRHGMATIPASCTNTPCQQPPALKTTRPRSPPTTAHPGLRPPPSLAPPDWIRCSPGTVEPLTAALCGMAGAQRSPSRAPSSAGNRNMDDSANGAALLGALMAFGGASKTNGDMIRSRGNSPGTSASSLRRPPPSRMTNTSPSPYRQPTALAAARMSPVPPLRPNYTGEAALQRAPADKQRPGPPPLKPKPRRLSEHQLKPASTSHIPPSTSFVGIVENNTLRSPKSKHGANVPRKPFSDMEVRGQANATPHEGKDQERGDKDGAQRQEGKGGAHTGSKGLPTGQSVPAKVQGKQQTGYGGPRGKEVQGTPVRKTQRDNGAEAVISDGESSQEYVSASEDTAPSPATQRKQKPDAVSQQSPVSLPSRSPLSHAPQLYPNGMSQPVDIARRPRTSDSSARSTSSHSNPSISATYHQLYPRRTTPLTLGDDLANAMVASSLATSRASSPHRLAPPVPQPRRPSHLSPWRSRTPSPTKAKGMRHTLREPESSSESDTEQHPYGKHKKKRHLRPKHPNKHHEGMPSICPVPQLMC